MRVRSRYLFNDGHNIRLVLQGLRHTLENEIGNYDLDYIRGVDEDELCRHLLDKYCYEPPKLRNDEVYVEGSNSDPGFSRSMSTTIHIPFDGNGTLFGYKLPAGYPNLPRGQPLDQEILVDYEAIEDTKKFEAEYKYNISEIDRCLKVIREEIENYNGSLGPFIKQCIAARKQKLLDDQEVINALGIPIKRRDDIPKAYEIPIATKKPKIAKPKATAERPESEWILREDEYENILEIICSMSLAMERSPRIFYKLEEEEIRDFFLVFLNGHYGWEAQVAGEVFNYTGKTDILIRFEGENVFIAECKFWKGEKGLKEAIDQLFGYITWRDTKTAIFIQ